MAMDRHRCCEEMTLEDLADFGTHRGFDYSFMWCSACKAWVMSTYWCGSSTPSVIDVEYYPAMSRQLDTIYRMLASCVETLDLPDV